MYDTIIIDTADLLYNACEKFIKTQYDIQDLSELGYGKAYNRVKQEFEEAIMSLGRMGYTLIFISHAEKKDYIDTLGVSHSGITPTLPKRGKEIIAGLVDVIAFVGAENDNEGGNKPIALLRGGVYGNTEIEAGTRYKEGIPAKIDWSYESLMATIEAADKAMSAKGVKLDKKAKTLLQDIAEKSEKVEKRPFVECYSEVTTVLDSLKERMANGELELAEKVKDIVNSYMGEGKKITDATPNQQELVEGALVELKQL